MVREAARTPDLRGPSGLSLDSVVRLQALGCSIWWRCLIFAWIREGSQPGDKPRHFSQWSEH